MRLPEHSRILIIRLRRVGDLLLLTPTLRAIRAEYPNAHMDLLVSEGFHHAILNNPHINRVIVVKRGIAEWWTAMEACARHRYDGVLDFQSSTRSVPFVIATHAAVRVGWRKGGMRDWAYTRHVPGWDEPMYMARNFLRLASMVGVKGDVGLGLDLVMDSADRQRASAVFEQASIDPQRPIIALSVVSKVARKRWPPDRYAVLADQLMTDHGAQLIMTNGPGELEQVRSVVERMKAPPAFWNYKPTTLPALAALYERCHLWIGNDGGAKHVAVAVGCPTLDIIKAGDQQFWTDTKDPFQCAVCDPEPELRDPDSLDGISVAHAYAAAANMLRLTAVRCAMPSLSGSGDDRPELILSKSNGLLAARRSGSK